MSFTSVKADEPKTTAVVHVPNKKIDLLNIYIPAYATTLPDELSDLLWQIHRQIKELKS